MRIKMIKAPYNFVPLNKEVFYPSWSNEPYDISHDVPFKDGESGEIDIKITAESPIFIRNHSNDKDKPSSKFCNHKNIKYIPGSSLKGVIKTLVEIIGFSKLEIQDKTLSYRDLYNPSYKRKAMDGDKIYMGWLHKNNKNWIIENIGKITEGYTRIKYTEMEKYFSKSIVNNIKKTKEAYKKYELVDFNQLNIDKGTIVFTGSTGNKTREFLFPNVSPIDTYTFEESDKLIKTFEEAYYIGTPDESKDWKYLWKKRVSEGNKIPVFFQLDDNGDLKHFGLSMLYKLPYKYSLQKILEKYQDFSSKKDLAETIFGYTNDEDSLKGRVQFSHLKCIKEVKYNKELALPLSSPRPTFYPNYLVQCIENGKTNKFITYDRLDAILRGFKMYPPRKNPIEEAKNEKDENFCTKNSKLCTKFTPLNKGSVFEGTIRFHNLKKVEIGALVSALTFINQNKEEKYFHKIGMGKAYGFGTTTIKINSFKTYTSKSYSNKSADTYINDFLNFLNKELSTDLLKHPRIEALLKLSSYSFEDEDLEFMQLKEFANAKKDSNKFCLDEVVENAYDKAKICKKDKKNKPNSTPKGNKTVDDLSNFFNNR